MRILLMSKALVYFALAAILFLAVFSRASAQTILYSEGFDAPVGANGDVYFADSPSYNGITDGTSSGGISTGASFVGNANENGEIINTVTAAYGTISAPQAGGFFLYENSNSNFTAPTVVFSTQGQPTITVTPNTNYTFSFYLNNQDNIAEAQIQAFVNGTAVGSAVSATGVNAWDQFTVTWNSGSATTAVLELDNNTLLGTGNDFGVDSIQFATVPEPRDWALWAMGLVLGLSLVHRTILPRLNAIRVAA